MTNTFWDRQAKHFDEGVRVHDALYEKTVSAVLALLSESATVLDFGCATGETSLDLAPHVQQVQGIDLSGNMIELARQKASERHAANVAFEQMGVFDPRLGRGSFSAVIAFNIFHLLPDVGGALARLHELLAPGGVLISQTPCLGEKRLLFHLLLNPLQKLGIAPPLVDFKIAELEALVSGSGFSVVESCVWDEKSAVQWIVARTSPPAPSP